VKPWVKQKGKTMIDNYQNERFAWHLHKMRHEELLRVAAQAEVALEAMENRRERPGIIKRLLAAMID